MMIMVYMKTIRTSTFSCRSVTLEERLVMLIAPDSMACQLGSYTTLTQCYPPVSYPSVYEIPYRPLFIVMVAI